MPDDRSDAENLPVRHLRDRILNELRDLGDPANVVGMARYGIESANTLGVPMPKLHGIARRHRKHHELALLLWDSGVHEARILAALTDDPRQVSPAQMDIWVKGLDSWDVCDQLCGKLFVRTKHAWAKSAEWIGEEPEFVRRAGFVLVASLAVHNKEAENDHFSQYFPLAESAANDSRNYVKKGVSWSLRQMGKRNAHLHACALLTAARLKTRPEPSARWIGNDVYRDLTREKVVARLAKTGK